MTAALVLSGYAAVLTAVGLWWLPRASWPLRAPRAGIAVWQALTVTVIMSAALAGLALAVPAADGILHACMTAFRAQYATPGAVVEGAAGAVLALAILGRAAWCSCGALADSARRRASHDDALTLVGRPGPVPGVVLIEHDQPAAYCLPGRPRIVLTTGALRCLDGRQLDAVLEHERAHLAARHHLVLALAAGLRRAFPRFRLFAIAAGQITCLVEMAADDAAARRADRLALAAALLAMATARTPAGALGAGGTAAALRVRRLIEARGRPGWAQRSAIGAAIMLAVPALTLSAPAFALWVITSCSSHGAVI